ncbi:hypothetical protein MJD09_16220, partial [bacterium]|nr:hypothetical protein [bacterium]
WAVPLALMELRAADDLLVKNTYVIMVTDGEKYEDDYADEESQAFRYGDRTSPQWASEKAREFKRRYSRLGGASSGRPSAWSASIAVEDGKSRVFADLYFLASKSIHKSKQVFDEVEEPLNIEHTWRKGDGEAFLDLRAQFSSSFQAVLQNARLHDVGLEFTRALNFVNAESTGSSAFEASIPATGDACEGKAVDYNLVISAATQDPILGRVVYTKVVEGSLGELRAPFCGSAIAALLTNSKFPTAVFALAIFGLAIVKWAQSRRELPIAIRSRHHLAERSMQRLRNPESEPEAIYSTILPAENAEAFRVVPKSWLAQRMVLPKTTLKMEVENGDSGTPGDIREYLTIFEEMPLPLAKSGDLIALWKRRIEHRVRIMIILMKDDELISKNVIVFPRSEDI